MAVGDAHVLPGFLTPVLTQPSFQSHRLLLSHASAEVRGKNTPERKFVSIGYRTHSHQVMSPTRSPLSHPGGALTQTHAQYINTAQNPNVFSVTASQVAIWDGRDKVAASYWHFLLFQTMLSYSFSNDVIIGIFLPGRYPCPNRQILDSSKLKDFANDNFNENVRMFSERYRQFLFFTKCFQKTCTANTKKNRACLVKG